jgi:hypothetical protein
MKAHRARRDTSELEIIQVLEKRGAYVRKLAQKGVPDLLVWWPESSRIHLIECKTGKGKLRETQQWDKVGLMVTILRSAEEAMRWNR